MNKIKVYPWQDVAWDIAKDQGMDVNALGNMTSEQAWAAAKTKLSSEIGLALLQGKLQALNSVGDPIKPENIIQANIVRHNYLHVSPKHVNPWLEQNGYLYEWNPQQTQTQSTPVSRGLWAEQEILSKIKEKGHDPLKLKRNLSGKPGIKAEIRRTLGKSGYWSGSTVFDKAWERLQQKGNIKYEV